MPDVLAEREKKAAKPHTCLYCGEVIQKGELYDWAKLAFDGRLYEWKSHKKCSFIALELWEYIDPDEGMTAEDFSQGCENFCRAFICPGCPSADQEAEDCREDKIYCTDKIYDLLQTHDFRRGPETQWAWRCVPKRKEE